jgi:hypothetical protein
MPQINLSQQEYKRMLKDFFVQTEERKRMSKGEVTSLANKLNEKKDIWFIDEKTEFKIFFKIIMKVDTFLYDHLPNEIYDLARDCDNGLSDDEVTHLTTRLTKLSNDKIDLPYLPEIIEKYILGFIIKIIINSLRHGWNIDLSIEKEDNLVKIPTAVKRRRGRTRS